MGEEGPHRAASNGRCLSAGDDHERGASTAWPRDHAIVDDAVDWAEKSPYPDPEDCLTTDVYYDPTRPIEPERESEHGGQRPTSRRSARASGRRWNATTASSSSARTSAVYGGAFKVTAGMLDEFGPDRVIDTPISESAIVGAAIGASLNRHAAGRRDAVHRLHHLRLRPDHERSPPSAATAGAPACPSWCAGRAAATCTAARSTRQNPEMYFAHTPGLKVVHAVHGVRRQGPDQGRHPRPGSGALTSSTSTSTGASRKSCPTDDYIVPIGKAALRREGRDLTIVTYGAMVYVALEAAEELAKGWRRDRGHRPADALPLDEETILRPRRRRPSKVIMLHEDTLTGGPAARSRRASRSRRSTTWTGPSCASRRRTRRCRTARRWRKFVPARRSSDVLDAARILLDY